MLTTEEATQAIADSMPAFASESVSIAQASGRILRQAVAAERDQPPFDRVTMDGIALSFASLDEGNRQFNIQATQYAGDPAQKLASSKNCIEIMTGAALPAGTDCIVPVERLTVKNRTATIEDGYRAEMNQFVHPRGSDYQKGHQVLQPNSPVSPLDLAVIASCGLDTVQVSDLPAIRVISTGNELVPAGQSIAPHQIRMSNGPALIAMLQQHGYSDVAHEHLTDEPARLESRLAKHLDEAAVLVLSGGVSMGKADFVPQALENLGVRLVFHKIRQRPGKPMWFGIGPKNQAVFALPGNPVSSLVCCRQYVLPALRVASGGILPDVHRATLTEDVRFAADLTFFMPVRITAMEDGRTGAIPVRTNTSGDFSALSGTYGYVELAREHSVFPTGTIVPLHPW
ncbi:MAG: molybdopterin molybdotransferase MoeA [Woeseiaceae bacterium]